MASFDGSNKGSVGKAQNIKYWEQQNPILTELKKQVMDNASQEAIDFLDPLNYQGPHIIADASTLTEAEWQAKRADSIGSSAVSQIFGESPYEGCTNLDLYNSKVGIKPAVEESDADKWRKTVMFKYGHDMEELLQLWVEHRWPGCKVIIDTNIYADPKREYLTANLDGIMQREDGSFVHLEFKTTSEFGKDAYKNGTIPQHYKRQLIQCQHIMGIWESYIIVGTCREDFLNDNVIVVKYIRDLDEEYEQVIEAEDFWENHVLPQIPPYELLGPTDEIIKSLKKYSGLADKKLPPVELGMECMDAIYDYVEVSEQLDRLKKQMDHLKTMKEKAMIPIIAAMGQHTVGRFDDGRDVYEVSYKPRAGARTCDFKGLELDHPDIYEKYVSRKEEGSRPMTIKKR